MVEESNGKVKVPVAVLLGAIAALGGYSAKLNTDLATVMTQNARILEGMRTENRTEFERVHAEHVQLCAEQARLRTAIEKVR